jgi:hypothetical protein
MMNNIPFQFQPVSSSWVALHPHPKGIIQFIGGAFFGRLPTIYYRLFLQRIFEEGYTVVAFPFRSTLNHWTVALDLLEEHYRIRCALIELDSIASKHSINRTKWNHQVYLKPENYAWIGHSLGCKYIALLELLTEHFSKVDRYLKAIALAPQDLQSIRLKLGELEQQIQQSTLQIEHLTGERIEFGTPGILNESSVLLAPVITDLTTAIPLKSLRLGMRYLGLEVWPSVEQTHQLIEHSQCFNLTAIVQFERDHYAKPTCDRLMFGRSLLTKTLPGRHLAPMLHDYSQSHLTVLQSLEQLKHRLEFPEPERTVMLQS